MRYLGLTAEGEGTNKKMAKAVAARNMLALVCGEEGEVREAGEEVDSPEVAEAIITTNTVGELQEFCISKGLGQAQYQVSWSYQSCDAVILTCKLIEALELT